MPSAVIVVPAVTPVPEIKLPTDKVPLDTAVTVIVVAVIEAVQLKTVKGVSVSPTDTTPPTIPMMLRVVPVIDPVAWKPMLPVPENLLANPVMVVPDVTPVPLTTSPMLYTPFVTAVMFKSVD